MFSFDLIVRFLKLVYIHMHCSARTFLYTCECVKMNMGWHNPTNAVALITVEWRNFLKREKVVP